MDQFDEKINLLSKIINDTTDWETVNEANGITSQRKMMSGSNIACFKSFGLVNAGAEKLKSFVWNVYDNELSMKKYDPEMLRYQIIEDLSVSPNSGELARLCYQINKLPWPLWSRDLVYLQRSFDTPDGSFILMYSVESNATPRQDDKYVRANINISAYGFTQVDVNRCMVYRIAHIDPAGLIPTNVINSYASKTTKMIEQLKNIYG